MALKEISILPGYNSIGSRIDKPVAKVTTSVTVEEAQPLNNVEVAILPPAQNNISSSEQSE